VRVACVDLPALPLQLLWRREPTWRALPTVVVDEDRPQGTVRWACERARAGGVLPGQRYAHALALVRELRAGVIAPAERAAAEDAVARRLHTRSPEITRGDDASFWLGGAGLGSLYPSATAWGRALVDELAALGLRGAVVIGFSRFATYGLARALGAGLGDADPTALRVFACDADERAAVRAVPLDRLALPPRLRDELARLGVTTLGQLVRLPGGGVLERFGPVAHRLYTLAAGEGWDPLAPEPPPEAIDERVDLDEPEVDAERLVFATKAALDRLLVRLAAKRRALVALSLEWNLQLAVGRHQRRVDCVKPAAPTLDGRALLGLVRLRLEHQPPVAGVVAIRVWADDVAATREQLALFAERPRRDLRAADVALAKLRAELGDDAVVRPVLRDAHLPEHQFGWEPIARVVLPAPRRDRPLVLVRRVLTRPRLLPPQSPRVRDDGWVLSGLEHGTVTHIVGPYVVSGGWWLAGQRAIAEPLLASVDDPTAPLAAGICREYHFADTRRGDCLWLFHDPGPRRWFLHGAIG
jgi:protein ImuB